MSNKWKVQMIINLIRTDIDKFYWNLSSQKSWGLLVKKNKKTLGSIIQNMQIQAYT